MLLSLQQNRLFKPDKNITTNHTINSFLAPRSVQLQKDYRMGLLLECLHEAHDPKLYQVVAEEWGGEHLSLIDLSPVACLSAGCLLPRLPYLHIDLQYPDDHHIVLFTNVLCCL